MENKKNKKVTVIIISILIVIILVLGLTFAYLRTELSGSEEIVKVGTLDLILNETSEGISLNNVIGISDSQGMSITPSTFELKNNGNKAVDYIIYLDDNTIGDNDTRIDDKYLKYNLNKNGEDSGALILTSSGSNPNRILDMGTIEGDSTNKYSLNLWISDEVDGNYSGQVFSGKLRVEVSQERPTVAEVLLADNSNNINNSDPEQTFITGENPNNYIWYSGKLWRAVSIDPSDNSVKLVTQWNISTISYNEYGNANFEGSYMQEWLNDTTVDGFLGNLREPEKFIKMDSKWNATAMTDANKPSKTTIVESPVGLLNLYEYTMSYSGTTYKNGYLNNGLYFWLLNSSGQNNVWHVGSYGDFSGHGVLSVYGVRPSINLQSNIKIVDGSGTETDPYRLIGDNDNNLSGTYLKDRYSGEYIRFGTGENNLYRIVSHETERLTKITSAEPLKKDGEFVATIFGNDEFMSDKSVVSNFLNDDYLINYVGSDYEKTIEDNTIWYLGNVNNSSNSLISSYKFSKYSNFDMGVLTLNVVNLKIGLLRYGELMSGQFSSHFDKDANKTSNLTITYWLLTPFNSNYVWDILDNGVGNNNSFSTGVDGIKPALNLKSNVVITSGDGTKENPFEIALQ